VARGKQRRYGFDKQDHMIIAPGEKTPTRSTPGCKPFPQ
jgi:hypothetical protein